MVVKPTRPEHNFSQSPLLVWSWSGLGLGFVSVFSGVVLVWCCFWFGLVLRVGVGVRFPYRYWRAVRVAHSEGSVPCKSFVDKDLEVRHRVGVKFRAGYG